MIVTSALPRRPSRPADGTQPHQSPFISSPAHLKLPHACWGLPFPKRTLSLACSAISGAPAPSSPSAATALAGRARTAVHAVARSAIAAAPPAAGVCSSVRVAAAGRLITVAPPAAATVAAVAGRARTGVRTAAGRSGASPSKPGGPDAPHLNELVEMYEQLYECCREAAPGRAPPRRPFTVSTFDTETTGM